MLWQLSTVDSTVKLSLSHHGQTVCIQPALSSDWKTVCRYNTITFWSLPIMLHCGHPHMVNNWTPPLVRGATMAEKLRGTKVWVPTLGRLFPAGCWVREGLPLPLWGSGFTPGKFSKTQMLNFAFWWLLAVKFIAFWKLRPRSWGTNTLLAPNLEVGGPFSPGSYGCCAYAPCPYYAYLCHPLHANVLYGWHSCWTTYSTCTSDSVTTVFIL